MTHPSIALYPGTFDPLTYGHLDIIQRAANLADRLVIGVASNGDKGPLFSAVERVDMIRAEVEPLGLDIEVRPFDTLLVHFAEEVGARILVRGLRAVSDFEYEFQMVWVNTRLSPRLETVFLMATDRHQFISSRFVKEIARLGGDVSTFLSPRVAERLRARYAQPPRQIVTPPSSHD